MCSPINEAISLHPLRNGFWNSQELLGIPNHNNSGSKNLEIPRNSQKFPEIPSL